MDGQEKFYICIWCLITLVLTTLIVSIATTKITDSNNIAKLVMNGAPPTQAYCAINNATDGRCTIATIGAKCD